MDEIEIVEETPTAVEIMEKKCEWCDAVLTMRDQFEHHQQGLTLYAKGNNSGHVITIESDLATQVMNIIVGKAKQIEAACTEFITKVNAIK